MAVNPPADAFETARPLLLGLAYRMLGSRADAEDAVQDTYLKWRGVDHASVENPSAWLTSACTRRCIDLMRSAHRARVDYVGSWLPEPIHALSENTPEARFGLASSLTTAFLLLLERLTPKERAAYLLHDIFGVPYPEIARTLRLQESACRKLVSRARTHLEQGKARHATPPAHQERLLAAFETALVQGQLEPLASLLSGGIELAADGGGKVVAVREVLHGAADVLGFLGGVLQPVWRHYRWQRVELNGEQGLVLRQDGRVVAAVSFAYDDAGRATGIYIMRNPDKLARLEPVAMV